MLKTQSLYSAGMSQVAGPGRPLHRHRDRFSALTNKHNIFCSGHRNFVRLLVLGSRLMARKVVCCETATRPQLGE